MLKIISNPRGTVDILPNEIPAWRSIEEKARELCQTYGYREIRTPVFEEVALFKRSLGETTEVVNKQLLEVKSQKSESEGVSFALRPEGTAPVVRVYNQNNWGREEFVSKLFYIGPMFRGERPQKGRLRQFHQIGAEAIGRGAANPLVDIEMIVLAVGLLKAFGVEGFKLKINSLGTAEDKAGFAEWLRKQLKGKIDHLSDECKNQYERNVFRLLDSKDKDCQEVVRGLNIGTAHLSEKGLQYFEAVKNGLGKLGIAYEVSNQLVRGLDYYTHTVFEISCEGLGAQDALGAGGRYDGLIEQLGGGDKRFPGTIGAIGFALGMERILLALATGKKHGPELYPQQRGEIEAFVLFMGQENEEEAFHLLQELRSGGIKADMDFGKRSFGKQKEWAVKLNPPVFLTLGEDEVRNKTVSVSWGGQGQISRSRSEIVKEVRKVLKMMRENVDVKKGSN